MKRDQNAACDITENLKEPVQRFNSFKNPTEMESNENSW